MMNVVFGFLGLAGGILCAVRDILFDLKGKGNKKLGTSGMIDSNWLTMSYWRFGASILVVFLAMLWLGLVSMPWLGSYMTRVECWQELSLYVDI